MIKKLLTIVIPCLNEEATIKAVVQDGKYNASKYFGRNYEIVVADNGSIDGSLKILRKMKGIRLIKVSVKGYGAALHWGIMNSYGKYVLFADADLSYPFSNIGKFKSKLTQNPDLVLGSRFKGHIEKGSMPLVHRYFGTPLLTLLIRIIYRIPTTDCNSGMRMVRKDFYSKLNMRNSGMEWASELLLKTALKNGKYVEVPISFVKDSRQRSSHLATWSDGWRHLKAIFLLKPQTFVFFMALCLVGALLSYPSNFGFTGFFILMFSVLFFSLLALEFLAFAIEGVPNRASRVLNSNYFVPVIVLFFVTSVIIVGLLSDRHLGSKILLSGIDAVVIIWTFLIETIKTHLINRLPNNYFK